MKNVDTFNKTLPTGPCFLAFCLMIIHSKKCWVVLTQMLG